MTSVSGASIVAAPCCGARYKKAEYSSVHIRNQHLWSDGFSINEGYTPPEIVCLCTCGQFFLAASADMADFLSSMVIRDQTDEAKPELVALPWLPELTKADAFTAIQNKVIFSDAPIEREVRLMYWRLLNDRFRVAPDTLARRIHRTTDAPWSKLSDAETDRML